MEQAGLCDVCGKPGKLYSCAMCGKRVCAEHYDFSTKTCAYCKKR